MKCEVRSSREISVACADFDTGVLGQMGVSDGPLHYTDWLSLIPPSPRGRRTRLNRGKGQETLPKLALNLSSILP